MQRGKYKRSSETNKKTSEKSKAAHARPEVKEKHRKAVIAAMARPEVRKKNSEAQKGNKNGNYKHGFVGHSLYNRWREMRYRCYNPNNQSYKFYGKRGITVCEEWRTDFLIFYNWCMLNGYKKELQLDRKNNDGNYEPGNCRFITPIKNSKNRRKQV